MRKDIQEAHKALAKQKQAVELIDRHGKVRGQVGAEVMDGSLYLRIGDDAFSLETLEKWVKQAKTARKNNYL